MSEKKLLDRVRDTLRRKNYAYRTEQAYTSWIKRYILYHHKRHPEEMGEHDIEAFLTYLAVESCVSPSTQNQALAALQFLCSICPWTRKSCQHRQNGLNTFLLCLVNGKPWGFWKNYLVFIN